MTIYKITIAALAMTLALGLGTSSCKMDDKQASAPAEEQLTPDAKDVITFTFEAPKGLPTTYAPERIHDWMEWDINNVDGKRYIEIYEFLASNKKFIKAHTLQLTPESGQPRYTAEMKVSDFMGEDNSVHPGEKRILVFVANTDDVIAPMTQEISIDDFYKRLLKEASANSSDNKKILKDGCIPMVGEALMEGSEPFSESKPRYEGKGIVTIAGGAHIKVDLIRAVARIDLRVTMNQSLSHMEYKRLTVKGMRLYNAPCLSTLGERKALAENQEKIKCLRGAYPITEVPTGGIGPDYVGTDGVHGHFSKCFYLYETPADGQYEQSSYLAKPWDENSTEAMTGTTHHPIVDFTVTYGDDTKEYHIRVPFTYQEKTADGKMVTKDIIVKRNHIYTIVLGPKEGLDDQGAYYKILVNEWDRQVDIPKALELIYPSGSAEGLDASKHTLTLKDNSKKENIEIPFASNFKEDHSFTATLKEVTNRKGEKVKQDWITPTFADGKLKITVQENSGADSRSVVIVVKGDKSAGAYVYELKVTQPGKTKPAK